MHKRVPVIGWKEGDLMGISDLLVIKCLLCSEPRISITKDDFSSNSGSSMTGFDTKLLFLLSALDKLLNFYESQLSLLKNEDNYSYFTG